MKAQLWFHLRLGHKATTVSVQLSRLSSRSSIRSLRLSVDAQTNPWQSVDMKQPLQAWLKQPESSFGIEIKAVDAEGRDLAVTSAESGEEGLVRRFWFVFRERFQGTTRIRTGVDTAERALPLVRTSAAGPFTSHSQLTMCGLVYNRTKNAALVEVLDTSLTVGMGFWLAVFRDSLPEDSLQCWFILDGQRKPPGQNPPVTEPSLPACSTSTSTNNSWDWIGHVPDQVLDVATSMFRHSHITEGVRWSRFGGPFPGYSRYFPQISKRIEIWGFCGPVRMCECPLEYRDRMFLGRGMS